MTNQGYFDQFVSISCVCAEHQCRWKHSHCKEHKEIGHMILIAYGDSNELVNEEVSQSNKRTYYQEQQSVKDPAKWLADLVKASVDPAKSPAGELSRLQYMRYNNNNHLIAGFQRPNLSEGE